MNSDSETFVNETEMSSTTRLGFPWLLLLSGITLIIGCLIPSFYELTENGRFGSHRWESLQIAGFIAIAITLAGTIGMWIWRRKTAHSRNSRIDNPMTPTLGQFRIVDMLAATTMIGVLIAATRFFEMSLVESLPFLGIAAVSLWAIRCPLPQRARIHAMFAVAYFPFAWVIAVVSPIGQVSGMISAVSWAPWLGLAFLVNSDRDYTVTVASIIAFLYFASVLFLTWKAPKWATGLIILLGLLSTGSSMLFHVLYLI